MQFSNVCVALICVLSVIGNTCGRRLAKSLQQAGSKQGGQYEIMVGNKKEKSNEDKDSECKDDYRHCRLLINRKARKHSVHPCERSYAKLICKKTCGKCENKDNSATNQRKEQEIISRGLQKQSPRSKTWKQVRTIRGRQPFPEKPIETGGRNVPRRGVYYIFTKQVYL